MKNKDKKTNPSITTIKINRETKERLDRLKEYKRETYDEVLRKVLFILNVSKKNPEKATQMFKRLDSVIKRKSEDDDESD